MEQRSDKEPGAGARSEAPDGLRMAPELMLDLARKAAELVVERIEGLPGETPGTESSGRSSWTD